MAKKVTTTDIYSDDLPTIDKHKSIPQEPRRDSLHRLLIAGDRAIDEAKKAAEAEESGQGHGT